MAQHRLALLTPRPPLSLGARWLVSRCSSAMLSACSTQLVRAMDPDRAIAEVRNATPGLRRFAVIPNALLEGVDREQLLQCWMKSRD